MGNPIKVEFSPDLTAQGYQISIASLELIKFSTRTEDYDFSPCYNEIIKELNSNYTIESIKDDPIIAKYRKFNWKFLKVDPTKTRPSSEALIRRILKHKPIPKISPAVDAYNWASIKSLIPLGAYDANAFSPEISIRLTEENEIYEAIGGKIKTLKKNLPVTSSSDGRILCQYPYRDAQFSMVTPASSHIIILAYGVPGVSEKALKKSITLTIDHFNWMKTQEFIDFEIMGEFFWKTPDL